jgi:hypothetical protein
MEKNNDLLAKIHIEVTENSENELHIEGDFVGLIALMIMAFRSTDGFLDVVKTAVSTYEENAEKIQEMYESLARNN